jgi:chorismate dehydratase
MSLKKGPLKVARISYTNTEPFFYHWPKDPRMSLVSGAPRALAQAAREGEVVAGPLPLVDCWKLEDDFVPLGFWGIACQDESRSVILLSNKPISKLDNITIGLTRESSSSVMLCQTLIQEKYGHLVTMKRGLSPSDDAWLMIGDQAFHVWATGSLGRWKVLTDLATEWWDWQGLPFVFAQWVVKKDLDVQSKDLLIQTLHDSFQAGMESLSAMSAHHAVRLGVSSNKIMAYLKAFIYQLGPHEEEAISIFRELVEKQPLGLVLAGR